MSRRLMLNDGTSYERLGFGVYKLTGDSAEQTVRAAIHAGYRRIDTAAYYDNEAMVGKAVASSGVPREDVTITTKIWNTHHGYEPALKSFAASLDRLGLAWLDTLLIHWPCPRQNRFVETWRALVYLKEQGHVRTIGVSNFDEEHLHRVMDDSGVVPAVNQIELHPHLQQEGLRSFHRTHAIATEAYSPLGRGAVLKDASVLRVARDVDRTAAQVVLRWHLQLGNLAIPKSSDRSRMAENLDVWEFELSPAHMEALARSAGDRAHPVRGRKWR